MFCHKCGTPIPDNGAFCPKCGTQSVNTSTETDSLTSPHNQTVQQILSTQTAIVTEPTYAPLFSFTGFFSSKGRRARGKAWTMGIVIVILLCITFYVFLSKIISPIIGLPIIFACMYANLMNLIKRLHDINLSGYWAIPLCGISILSTFIQNTLERESISRESSLNVVPLVLSLIWCIASLFVFCKAGTKGPNKFGPDPLEKPAEQDSAPTI